MHDNTITPDTPRWRERALVLGLVTLAGGALALLGWVTGIAALYRVVITWPPIAPTTALSLILLGSALALLARAEGTGARPVAALRALAGALSAAAALGGVLALAAHLTQHRFLIADLLFAQAVARLQLPFGGAPSPTTALTMALAGAALVLLAADRRVPAGLGQWLATLVCLLSLQALLIYGLGAATLGALIGDTGMAPPISVLFLALGVGALLLTPTAGPLAVAWHPTLAGALFRRLIIGMILLLAIGPLLRLLVQRSNLFGPGIVFVLFIAAGLALSGWMAQWLDRAERARQAADDALRERERKLSALLELLPVGISILDAQRTIAYTNPALATIVGLSEAELQTNAYAKRTYLDAAGNPMPPDGFASARVFKERRAVQNVETGIVNEAGRLIWTNVSAVPVDFPDWSVVVVTSDITDRKHAEQALERSAARLRVLANASRAFAEVGADYQVLLDQIARTTMAVLGEGCIIGLISNDQEWMQPVMLYDVEPERRELLPHLLGNTPLRLNEPVIITQIAQTNQSRMLPVVDREQLRAATQPAYYALIDRLAIHSLLGVPMRVQGRPIGAFMMYRCQNEQPPFDDDDLTLAQDLADRAALAIANARLLVQVQHELADRTKAESELRALSAELEQRVADRTAELAAANKELEAFSYSVSHDLRAPLRAIDGFSRILLEDYIADLPDDAQHYFQLVRSNVQQMGQLVDDLLAFARLSRQPLITRSVDMAALVRQCLEELGAEQAGRRIEISCGDLPVCQGDPALLKQVWFNLLANALKYTRQRDPAVIGVGSQVANGGEIIYVVRDNGAGFDMRYSDKLFGVFQRMHRAEDYEGTGVGLAIVQRIVHRHGGRIWAEAAADQGATFSFTLEGGVQ